MMGDFKYKKPLGKIIDALTILSIVGGMGVSLGLGVPIISAGIAHVMGVEANFTINLVVLLIVAVVFSVTSIIGIEKGMKKLSDLTMYLMIIIIAFIFIVVTSRNSLPRSSHIA